MTLAAIKDIPMGKRLGRRANMDWYDFSHLLPKGVPGRLRSSTYERLTPGLWRISVFYEPSASRRGEPSMLAARLDVSTLEVGSAHLKAKWQGKGIGKAMYEAAYRTGYELGAREVEGSIHSTAAHRTHLALNKKHGWSYYAPARWKTPDYPTRELFDKHMREVEKDPRKAEFDAAWGAYVFDLKG